MNPRFTVRGRTERLGNKQVNILVENAEELRAFYAMHAPDRNLDWAERAQPLFTVSKSLLVGRYTPGDWVEYLFELRPCKDGPRAFGLDLWVVGEN